MMNMEKAFFEFVYDRQQVWHNRNMLKLPAPWSKDEILQKFRFCNVYRELDGGTLAITRYLRQNFTPEEKLFNIIAYRFFNRRDTIENLFGGFLNPDTFDVKALEKRLDAQKQEGKLFSNAYLITAYAYKPDYRPHDKHVQVLFMLNDIRAKLRHIIDRLQSALPQEGIDIIVQEVPMAGPFLAGQILLDATYAGNIISYSSNDFLIVGPGAHWGLNIIYNKNLTAREADVKCRHLHALQKEGFAELKKTTGKDWDKIRWQNPDYCGGEFLSLHDVQNSLCEFRKYRRLKTGENAKKRYFTPLSSAM